VKNLVRKAKGLGIEIFNGAVVERLEELGQSVSINLANKTSIVAKKSIIATNGFASQLLDGLDLTPARNQVIVTEPIDDLQFRGTFHFDRGYYYFRNVDLHDGSGKQRILLGGGRNLNPEEETTAKFGLTPTIQARLEELLHHVIFPKRSLNIEYRWSGILGVGQAKHPIVQRTSPSIIAAVRLGGMGVAIGSMTGEMASKMILEVL
jgi:glycine/D-amino acid oxidase-like deaminating enzyme